MKYRVLQKWDSHWKKIRFYPQYRRAWSPFWCKYLQYEEYKISWCCDRIYFNSVDEAMQVFPRIYKPKEEKDADPCE